MVVVRDIVLVIVTVIVIVTITFIFIVIFIVVSKVIVKVGKQTKAQLTSRPLGPKIGPARFIWPCTLHCGCKR